MHLATENSAMEAVQIWLELHNLDCLFVHNLFSGLSVLWRRGSLMICGLDSRLFQTLPGALYCDTTVTVSFSSQVYKWVLENLTWGGISVID